MLMNNLRNFPPVTLGIFQSTLLQEERLKLKYIQNGNSYFNPRSYKRSDLDGCQSTGDTLEELYENLNEAMEGYLEVKLENNLPIPLPERTENYSGKFNVRLPKSLHQRLAIQAEEEGVSLNQLVLYKLAL